MTDPQGAAPLDERLRYREDWLEAPSGAKLCALINGEQGWLMYLRHPGDAGMSSRNPHYAGDQGAEIEYRFANGQRDAYPAAWAIPLQAVERALEYFRANGEAAPFVAWHDDACDDALA